MRLIHVTTYNHTFSVLFSILLYKYNYPFHIDKLYIISALLCYHTNYYCQSVSQFSHSVVSDSLRPHESQPTRLRSPWDSPGKNTGVGCHFLLKCRKVKSESEVAQSCPTLSNPTRLQPTRLLRPWDFPGKSTGVGCHCLLPMWC